ncbi:glycosyltransferase family 4 protein [Roseomonas marmotae]|nr:glycosyltransferase family 4 protein [Roseomonas marmotae]
MPRRSPSFPGQPADPAGHRSGAEWPDGRSPGRQAPHGERRSCIQRYPDQREPHDYVIQRSQFRVEFETNSTIKTTRVSFSENIHGAKNAAGKVAGNESLLRRLARSVSQSVCGGNVEQPEQRIRVAVACSGLGHVQRGIESWARDLGAALDQRRASVEATLFAGAPLERALDVFCWRRSGHAARLAAHTLASLGGWRFGMGSTYEVEQTSFALGLIRHIRTGFDILHVQDVAVAKFFDRAHALGLSRPRVLFANGTGEGPEVLGRFRYLQHLTPRAFESWAPAKPAPQRSYMVPNFVKVAQFASGSRQQARERLGIDPDATVVLCCAAIRKKHKRIDCLIREFADARRLTNEKLVLVMAGGRETDTPELISLAKELLDDSVRIFVSLPREEMGGLYAASDIFVLPSLFELFGIVLIEAMASGLPILCHDTPDFRYVAGEGALYRDLSVPGGIRDGILDMLRPEYRAALADRAKRHIRQTFDEEVVVPQIIQMYQDVVRERQE